MTAHPSVPKGTRERILDTASGLFSRRGVKDVGVEELIARSEVAKATFYRHFRSKDGLALAYLDRCWEQCSAAVDAAARHTGAPGPGLLAVFDEWFRQGPAQARSLLHVMIEMGPGSPLGQAAIARLARIRDQLAGLAREGNLADPEGFARSCQILLHGSVIAAAEGDPHAPERTRHLAALLLAESRPRRVPVIPAPGSARPEAA